MKQVTGHRDIVKDTLIAKNHIKLYKKGTKWIALGITTFSLGLAGLSISASASITEVNSDSSTQNDSQSNTLQQKSVPLTSNTTNNSSDSAEDNSSNVATVSQSDKINPTSNNDSMNKTDSEPSETHTVTNNQVVQNNNTLSDNNSSTEPDMNSNNDQNSATQAKKVVKVDAVQAPTSTETVSDIDEHNTDSTINPLKEKTSGYNYQLESKTVTETIITGVVPCQ